MKDGGQQRAAAVLRQPWGASLRPRHLHKNMKVVEMGALKFLREGQGGHEGWTRESGRDRQGVGIQMVWSHVGPTPPPAFTVGETGPPGPRPQ